MHTNCFAALSNMASHFKNLHPYVSQKLIGLLEAQTRLTIVFHLMPASRFDKLAAYAMDLRPPAALTLAAGR